MIRCPRCNSKEIYAVTGGYGGYYYRCKKCGYSGAFVVEYDDDKAPEERRELQKEYQHEVDEYEERHRTLIWAILVILAIAIIFGIIIITGNS